MWWGLLETVKQYFNFKDKQKQYQGKQPVPESCTTSQRCSSLQCQRLPSPSAAGSALQTASFPSVDMFCSPKTDLKPQSGSKIYLFPHRESHLTRQKACSVVQQMPSSNAAAIHRSLTLGNTL